jgi:hypothetical protein
VRRVKHYRLDANPGEDVQRQLFGAGASMRDTRVVQCLVAAALDVEAILAGAGVEFKETEFTERRLTGLGGVLIANHIVWATHRKRGRGDRTDGRHCYG